MQLGEIMHLLSFFRESFTATNIYLNSSSVSQLQEMKKKNEGKNYQSYREVQQELKLSKNIKIRKQRELQFLEQLWMTLNPQNEALLRIDTAKEFLKILFSPLSASIKEMADILSKFLQACFFLSTKSNEVRQVISPITENSVNEEELWSLERLIKEFLNLKENMLAYQGIKNIKPNTVNEFEAHNKVFTFKPKILKTKTTEINKMSFDSRLKKFEEQKKETINKKAKEIEDSVS